MNTFKAHKIEKQIDILVSWGFIFMLYLEKLMVVISEIITNTKYSLKQYGGMLVDLNKTSNISKKLRSHPQIRTLCVLNL